MLKFLGSLFIVSSMTGIGIWKAEEVKHSYQALGKIYHLIGMMKNELSYAGSEFGEMFECLSKKVDAPYRNWLLGMKIQMERRDGKTFSEIWEDNVNGFLKESGLGMEALNHLKMLGTCYPGECQRRCGTYLPPVRTEEPCGSRDVSDYVLQEE